MKLGITAVPVVLGRFTLPLPEPGIVRHVAFEKKQTLVMQRGQPSFEEVPVLFVEVSPGAPVRVRKFEVMPQGKAFEVDDGEIATWRATNISGQGKVVHVFEIEGSEAS